MAPGARDRKSTLMTPEQLRASRLHAEHLCPKASAGDLIEVVRSLVGVNAQSSPAMMLSLRARIKGLERDDIRKALEERRLVRTWAMRGTVHLIAADDLGWLVSLLGPAILPKGRGRRRELGLDEDVIGRGLGAITAALGGEKSLTRDELTDRLIDRGVSLERKSQAPYHLIVYAALKGLVCLGPDRENGDQTYCLAEQWIGKCKNGAGDDALAELVIRYLRGYGPASPKDFSSWSGLSLADAKKGWDLVGDRAILRSITVENGLLWSPGSQLPVPEEPAGDSTIVNLLPAFDAFVLGYADREYLVPEKWRKEVYHGGQTVPVVLVNGRAAGVWRYERQGKKLAINVHPFERFDPSIRELVAAEAEDIERFFGLTAALAWH
jgi:DNA glycosylase AlkZ-like